MPESNIKPLALQWNQLALEAIKYSNTPPPVAARALAMVHTAIFDAWSVYSKHATSTTTANYIKRPAQNFGIEEIQKTFSYAAYRVLTDSFWMALPPEKRQLFRDLMLNYNYYPDDCSLNVTTAAGIGNLIARLVIDSRRGDTSNQHGVLFQFAPWIDFTGYQPLNPPEPFPVKDVNHWQPLLVNEKLQTFVTPHWGLVKPFALEYGSQFRPDPPYNSGSSPAEFKQQALNMILMSEALTDRQKAIAEYWMDGPYSYTPAGHWCEIAQFICERENYDEARCIKLFFALSNALLDVSIACWESKYHYDAVRPVTAVHTVFKGKRIRSWGGPYKGNVDMDGQNWIPYQPSDFVSPASAGHVSSHSSFGYAAATILQAFTRSDTFKGCTLIKAGSSVIEPDKAPAEDILLDWPTFTAAAMEASQSGLYGGIYFSRGIELGQKLGEAVGKYVWEKVKYYFHE